MSYSKMLLGLASYYLFGPTVTMLLSCIYQLFADYNNYYLVGTGCAIMWFGFGLAGLITCMLNMLVLAVVLKKDTIIDKYNILKSFLTMSDKIDHNMNIDTSTIKSLIETTDCIIDGARYYLKLIHIYAVVYGNKLYNRLEIVDSYIIMAGDHLMANIYVIWDEIKQMPCVEHDKYDKYVKYVKQFIDGYKMYKQMPPTMTDSPQMPDMSKMMNTMMNNKQIIDMTNMMIKNFKPKKR